MTGKIRVLFDGEIYRRQRHGGISRMYNELLLRLGQHAGGNRIEAILWMQPGCQAAPPEAPWVRRFDEQRRLRPQRVFGRFEDAANARRLGRLRPHIFQSTYYTTPGRVLEAMSVRRVVMVYDFIHERFPSMFGEPEFVAQKRREIERADAIVAISHSTGADVLRFTGAKEDRITVMPLCASDTFLHRSTSSSSAAAMGTFAEQFGVRTPYWLFVGQRSHYKNFGTLLRAFGQAARCVKGDLVCVGGSPALDPWENDFLVQHRLEERVHVLHLPDEALRSAYEGAAAFVYPSLAEGFGIPLLEAMACNTPILASDIPVFHEVASDAAVYFDPHDKAALADALIDVLDTDRRRGLVTAGHRQRARYSWDEAVCTLRRVYESLV